MADDQLDTVVAPGGDMKGVTADLAALQKQKIAADTKASGELLGTMSKGAAEVQRAYKAEGVEPGTMKPWNEEEESAKRQTDPIQAFGSLGSVFGILASAFTHAPMENALNASAAAINAVKEGNAKDYDRAYKAWEANNKLAMDRHKIQHEAYQDAIQLLQTNMALGETKMRVLAARFGDQKTLTMLEHGMDKEVLEMMNARQNMALKMGEAQPKIMLENMKMADLLNSGYNPKKPTSQESMQAIDGWKQRWAPNQGKQTPADLYARRLLAENPDISSEEFAAQTTRFLRESHAAAAPEKLELDRARQQEVARHNQSMEEIQRGRGDTGKQRADEIERHNREMEKLKAEAPKGGSSSLTVDRQVAEAAARKKKELLEGGASPDEAERKSMEYARSLKVTAASPSGNKVDQMRSLYDRAGMMSETIDKMDSLMAKHSALAGLGGAVTRPVERVSNIFGSNATDRAQFERYVNEVQEWGSRVLNESAGRPLSSEVSKLAKILPGLNMGDTTANTVRAYREIKPLLAKIQAQLKSRMEGSWSPETEKVGAPAVPTGAGRPSWMSAPEVK